MDTEKPGLVGRALALAERLRFEHSCAPAVGRLLAVLAGRVRGGLVGEIGTGCGVGSAWMASALAPDSSMLTVEINPAKARAAGELLADVPNVHVLEDDWHELLAYGPFELLFADGGKAKEREPEALVGQGGKGGGDRRRLMPPRGFRVSPRRWVVERTFAWISHNRRMAKDYEGWCVTGETFVYAAMTRLMVRWLARA